MLIYARVFWIATILVEIAERLHLYFGVVLDEMLYLFPITAKPVQYEDQLLGERHELNFAYMFLHFLAMLACFFDSKQLEFIGEGFLERRVAAKCLPHPKLARALVCSLVALNGNVIQWQDKLRLVLEHMRLASAFLTFERFQQNKLETVN